MEVEKKHHTTKKDDRDIWTSLHSESNVSYEKRTPPEWQ